MKKMMFIAVLFSAIAPKVLSISTGLFQLSVFRAIIIISPIILVLITFIDNKNVKLSSINNRYSVHFMFIWMMYAIFTVAWVQDIGMWLRGVLFIVTGVTSIIMFQNTFRDKQDILSSFNLLGITTMLHNGIGWYEVVTGNYYFANPVYAARYMRTQRPVSTFTNVNDFSLFMFFGIFILYICYKNTRKSLMKVLYLIGIISSIIIIIIASSRGAMIGLSVAFIWFTLNVVKKLKVQRLITLFLLIIIILIALLPLINNMGLDLIQIDELYINLAEEGGRISLLKNGLYFLYRTLGFGVGAGNIEHWMLYEGIYPTGGLLNIHNWWAEILVGFGVIIFTMYIIFYIKLFNSMRRIYKMSNNEIDSSISLSIMCIMLGFIIAGISSSSNMDVEWLWVFWALAITYQGINQSGLDTQRAKVKL